MTLDLRHVNVLIGDQGTGKSTVAKVLHLVKTMLDETFLLDSPHHHLMKEGKPATEEDFKNLWNRDFAKWLEWTGLVNSIYPDTYLYFSNEKYTFLYEDRQVIISWKSDAEKALGTPVTIFIPAYREVALVLKDKLFAILQAKATLPDILTRFGTAFLEARTKKSFYDYREIFNVIYKHENGVDYIRLNDGKEIPIEDASSAIRNGLPMLIVFDNSLMKRHQRVSDTLAYNFPYCPYLIVEEPELNCFPETQEKLMKYFIQQIKEEDGYKNRLLITTHSPYMLTSLNNLMYAYVSGKSDATATDKVIKRKYWLNPDDVSAYILKDGICEDIFDRKEALIDVARIDEVSQVLNKQFDDLINIELGVANERDS